MKVLILGAAGKTARAVVSSLRSLPVVERLYLADHNVEALCRLSSDLAHPAVSTRYLDAEDESSLCDRMREADLVLGCLGPFHLHESRIARAAIRAGRDYLSMCDDPGSAQEVISLGREAAREKVRVLCGCGLTPGLSDLLARRASSRLDRVDSIEFAWFLELGPGLGEAALEHLLHSLATRAPVRRAGSRHEARAGSWAEAVEFPPPVGTRFVAHLAHPEPATLAAALGARDIWFKASLGCMADDLVLQSLARLNQGERTEIWRAAVRTATAAFARRGKPSCATALRVTAAGTKDGLPCVRAFCAAGDYYRISGLVMAGAVESLLRDRWEPGAYTAAEVLDHPRFFARLRGAGQRILIGETVG